MVDSSSSWLRTEFWIVMVAVFGGAIVLFGLWLEYVSEKNGQTADELFKNVKDFRFKRSLGKCGERIVMAGIIWEILTAGFFAYRDDLHIRQNDIAIKNADPRNQPIKSIRADVLLKVMGNNFNFAGFPVPKLYSLLDILGDVWLNTNMPPCNMGTDGRELLAYLQCSEFESIDLNNNGMAGKVFWMSFNWPSADFVRTAIPQDWISQYNITQAVLDKRVSSITIQMLEITNKSEMSGSCVLIFNGSTQRRFSIPTNSGWKIVCPLMTNSP